MHSVGYWFHCFNRDQMDNVKQVRSLISIFLMRKSKIRICCGCKGGVEVGGGVGKRLKGGDGERSSAPLDVTWSPKFLLYFYFIISLSVSLVYVGKTGSPLHLHSGTRERRKRELKTSSFLSRLCPFLLTSTPFLLISKKLFLIYMASPSCHAFS